MHLDGSILIEVHGNYFVVSRLIGRWVRQNKSAVTCCCFKFAHEIAFLGAAQSATAILIKFAECQARATCTMECQIG